MPIDGATQIKIDSTQQYARSSRFAFLGVPQSELLAQALQVEFENGYLPPIDIIEPDEQAFEDWLQIQNVLAAGDMERVNVFVGDNAVEQFYKSFHFDLGAAIQSTVIHNDRWGDTYPEIETAEFSHAITLREKKKQTLFVKQKEIYDESYFSKLKNRYEGFFAGRNRLKVAGITSRYSTVMQYSMEKLAAAFKRADCDFDIITERDRSSMEIDTWTPLAECQYDMAIVINHLRQEYRDRINPNVPYVCWIQDHMPTLWTEDAGRNVSDHDVVMTTSPWLLKQYYQYPPEQVVEISQYTDHHLFHCEPVDDARREQFACDLSFVSHGSKTPEELARDLSDGNETLHKYFQRYISVAQHVLDSKGYIGISETFNIMLTVERGLGIPNCDPAIRCDEFYPAIQRINDRLMRHAMLRWAVQIASRNQLTLRIYGRGWDKNQEFCDYAAGEVNNGDDLRCVFQSSRINLQAHGSDSFHHRLLDCYASGGLMLSMFNPWDFVPSYQRTVADRIAAGTVGTMDEILQTGRNDDIGDVIEDMAQLDIHELHNDGEARRSAYAVCEKMGLALQGKSYDDQYYFQLLKDMNHVPQKCAGEMRHYRQTVFCGEKQLEHKIQLFRNDEATRSRIINGMRQEILAHHTYDVLTETICRAVYEHIVV